MLRQDADPDHDRRQRDLDGKVRKLNLVNSAAECNTLVRSAMGLTPGLFNALYMKVYRAR